MRIYRIAGNTSGKLLFRQSKNLNSTGDIVRAIALVANSKTTSAITSSISKSLRNSPGWDSNEFQAFHNITQQGGSGRKIAIDARHQADGVCLEIELSNQTAFSHDLLKLETAFLNGHCKVGVVLVLTTRARANISGHCVSYLTFSKARHWLRIYSHLRAPIVIIGIE